MKGYSEVEMSLFNSLLEAENIRPYQQFYITVVASVLRTFVAIYKVYMSTCCMVI